MYVKITVMKGTSSMDWFCENALLADTVTSACGIDEAGRGPLAGPVFAAAVILPKGCIIEGLDDSKKLSEKKREKLFDNITALALDYAIASATPSEIDEINILNATMLAMKRAVKSLTTRPDMLLIDGNIARGFDIPAKTVIKGDSKLPSIAAASILAKVSRDAYCKEMDKQYPDYLFAKHKGYPTKLHRELLIKYGPCPEHRMSFLKKIFNT